MLEIDPAKGTRAKIALMAAETDRLLAVVREIRDYRDMLRRASTRLKPNGTPSTGTDAVTSMGARVASLGSAGMLAAAEGDVYAARALARILSEHWVRLMTIIADVKNSGDSIAGDRYWKDLWLAEAVQADKLVRRTFPGGVLSDVLPDVVRQQISRLLIDPAPTRDHQKIAKDKVDRYSFKQLVTSLRDALPDKTSSDDQSFGSLLATYPVLSGFVHGGPDAHQWLGHDGWKTRTVAALDIATLWSSVLIFVCAFFDRTGTTAETEEEARKIQAKIVAWHNAAMAESQGS